MKRQPSKRKSISEEVMSLPILYSKCAGIDLGATFHIVSISDKEKEAKKFGVYTVDLQAIVSYLLAHEIEQVAMESTGNYWKELYRLLEESGISVLLVNGKFTKNPNGKKTDLSDACWIQKLHSVGFLLGSHVPPTDTVYLQALVRLRKNYLNDAVSTKLRMLDRLRLMNFRLDNLLSDSTGKSGTAIIEAIIAGERDATELAKLVDRRVKKSDEEILKALTGNWRHEHVFTLNSLYRTYNHLLSEVKLLEEEIHTFLKEVVSKQYPGEVVDTLVEDKKKL